MKNLTAYDFRHLAPPAGFHNLNEAFDLSGVDWLHPVESLFGDWSGKTLILGQDFNSWSNVVNKSLENLKHDRSFATNQNLESIFGSSCDAVYANYSWFLKAGTNASAPISFRKSVQEANRPILEATIKGMPNLAHMFCLGAKVSRVLLGADATPLCHKRLEICGATLNCYSLPHPGALGLANYQRRQNISRDIALAKIRDFVQEKITAIS